jgi:glycolate oxidase iron-sulfur subunit
LRLADQCVKCGYCLPHCPTFRLRRDEAESPRGRIALIQGLLSGQLDESERLDVHLGNCLECLACEPACPSLVQFGALMDGVRAERVARLPRWRRLLLRLRLDLLSDPRALTPLALLAGLYRHAGLSWLLSQLGLLRAGRLAVLDGLARQLRQPRRLRVPDAEPVGRPSTRLAVDINAKTGAATDAGAGSGSGSGVGTVKAALFLGCVSRGLQASTAQAALDVLHRLGIPVCIPDGQTCCGAMHRHNGHADAADALLTRNRAAFGRPGFTDCTVVGYASACVAELQQGLNAMELCRFLVDAHWPEALSPRALPEQVAVHEPCSHRNLLQDTAAVYGLLARIPALEVFSLDGNDTCCGAAGTYLLQHPNPAQTLADDKIRHLAARSPRYLVTTNTGCAAHLAARIRTAGLAIEVLHPVELIQRQL